MANNTNKIKVKDLQLLNNRIKVQQRLMAEEVAQQLGLPQQDPRGGAAPQAPPPKRGWGAMQAQANGNAPTTGGMTMTYTDSSDVVDDPAAALPQPGNQFEVLSQKVKCPGVSKSLDSPGSLGVGGDSAEAGGDASMNENGSTQTKSRRPGIKKQTYTYYLVLDFEATCEKNVSDWPHEIIEFPVIAIDSETHAVVAEFHRYVKPTRNPVLTPFCTELTGITQKQVDNANVLTQVVEEFDAWIQQLTTKGPSSFGQLTDDGSPACKAAAEQKLRSMATAASAAAQDDDDDADLHELMGTKKKGTAPATFVLATDGPWDLRDFMYKHSVCREKVDFPQYCYTYLNIRKTYADFFKTKPIGIKQMLARQGMTFVGRPHSGIDDARNIARILVLLMKKGCRLSNTQTIRKDDHDRVAEQLLVDFVEEAVKNKNAPKGKKAHHPTAKKTAKDDAPPEAAESKKKRKKVVGDDIADV